MSALDDVLEEECERLKRIKTALEKELDSIPKGYLSRKRIKGKVYSYLQTREGEKIKSCFIPAADVPHWEAVIEHRRKVERSLKECNKNIKKLEKVL